MTTATYVEHIIGPIIGAVIISFLAGIASAQFFILFPVHT